MRRFIEQHRDKIIGVLSGFDRLIFRGTIRSIAHAEGMKSFLGYWGIRLRDFGAFAKESSDALKNALTALAETRGCPIRYLPSAQVKKEPLARAIASENGVSEGLVCVLTSVEPCRSFEIVRNAAAKKLELRLVTRKCLFAYVYGIDRRMGFMSIRLQTWLPQSIQIWINGREWLGRTMDHAGLRYLRHGNCFPWIEDFERAQQLMNQQLRSSWPRVLDGFAKLVNPGYQKLFDGRSYYWTVHQNEWATDVAFRDAATLNAIYPALTLHGITRLGCDDVLRFLGQRVHPRFAGDIASDFRNRPEGIRLKHRVDGNSIKAYDKTSILRVETTIHNAEALKVFRRKDGDSHGPVTWRPLRRGVADLHRRSQLGQAANDRYLDALAGADTTTPLGQLISSLCRPTSWQGRPFRALRPLDQDLRLVQAVADGSHLIVGFRNKDIRRLLFGVEPASATDRRQSARIGRLLRLLRAHGLIRKVPKTNRYQVTSRGRLLFSAALAASRLTLSQLQAA